MNEPVRHDLPALVDAGQDAVVSLRESSIVTLARAGVLDADQVAAAFRFRRLWREAADAGWETSSESCVNARGELARCRSLVGARGFELIARICGDGFHLRDFLATRRERNTASDMLRWHLSDLARLWS